MAGNFNLEGKNGEIGLKMLEDISIILNKHNIEFWLESGTLLGIVREGRLLPWDNDIDIAISEHSIEALLKVLPQISNAGYRVRVRRFKQDSEPFKKGVARTIKIRNKKLFFFKGEVSFDIYVKFKKDKKYFYQCGTKKKSTDAKFFENLEEIEFNKIKYKVPNNYKAYLTNKYGNWEIVDKNWCPFKNDHTIIGNVIR